MTVSSNTSTATFFGNGATEFPLPFRFFDNNDIQVYRINATTGAATAQSEGADYSLTGAGEPEVDGNATGEIVLTSPLVAGTNLYVERVMPIEQPIDIVNQGRFSAEVHEEGYDRVTMLIQQADASGRGAIRVALGDPEPNRLPPAASRAGQLMGFDDFGNPIVLPPGSGGDISDFAARLLNQTDPAQGTSLVGFAGNSSDTGRTLTEKLNEVGYVFNYLTPNQRNNVSAGLGTMDVTARVQEAMNENVHLIFNPGTYGISQLLHPPTLLRVEGMGAKNGVRLKHLTGSNGSLWRANDARLLYFRIENIYLEGHSAAGETCGFDVSWMSYGSFYDCRSRLFREDGLFGFGEINLPSINKQVSNLSFFGCTFNNNTRDGVRFVGVHAQRFENTALTFVGCEFAGNAGTGVYGDVCESSRWIGCTSQGNVADDVYFNSRFCEFTGYLEGQPKGVVMGPLAFGCKVEVRSAYPLWNTAVDNSTAQNNHLSVMGELDSPVHLFHNPYFMEWVTTIPTGLALLGTPTIAPVVDTRSMFGYDLQFTITAGLQGATLSITGSGADVAGKWVTIVADVDTSGVTDNMNTRVYAVDGTTLNTATGQFAVEPIPKTAAGMYRKLYYDVKFPDSLSGTATVRWYIGYDGVGAGPNVVKVRSLHLLVGQTRRVEMFAGQQGKRVSATAAQLGVAANGVNTVRKEAGALVYNSSTGKWMQAAGALATSNWFNLDLSATGSPITPA